MTLGERICRARSARNLSQAALAEALGVSRQSVSKWETDQAVPDLDKLVKLCELFDISLDELVRGAKPVPGEMGAQPPAHTGLQIHGANVRVIVGLMLLFLGGLGTLLTTIFLFRGSLLSALVWNMPLLICGAVTLRAKRHPVLACGWTMWCILFLILMFLHGIMPWWLWFMGFLGFLRGDGWPPWMTICSVEFFTFAALVAGSIRAIRKDKKSDPD